MPRQWKAEYPAVGTSIRLTIEVEECVSGWFQPNQGTPARQAGWVRGWAMFVSSNLEGVEVVQGGQVGQVPTFVRLGALHDGAAQASLPLLLQLLVH